jgi:translation elongation factor EF-G
LTDKDDEEIKRGITIKSTGISLYYEIENNESSTSNGNGGSN